MKIEVGETYTTVGGWLATVKLQDSCGHFYVHHKVPNGACFMWHYPDEEGRSNLSRKGNTRFDLIEEYTEQE